MPYSSRVVEKRRLPSGLWLVRVIETDAGSTDETDAIEGLPEVCEIYRVNSYLEEGTGVPGATIQPEIGRTAGWTDDTLDEVWGGPTSAARRIDAAPDKRAYLPDKQIFIRSNCSDATADHQIEHELLFWPVEA